MNKCYEAMMCQGETVLCCCQNGSPDSRCGLSKAVLCCKGVDNSGAQTDLPVKAEWVSTWADSPTPGSYSFTVS